MGTVEEYRRHAADREELARTAPTECQRKQIQGLAETWRKLAADRERKLGTEQDIQQRKGIG